MKQILSLTLALALTAALFTGCGCAANVSTHPGGMITEDTSTPAIMPHPTATHETKPRETTRPTQPQNTTLPQSSEPASSGSMIPDDTGSGSSPTENTGSIPGTTRAPRSGAR